VTAVDFFLDPICPFTWRTSRWITGVAEAGVATVTWRLLSLRLLQEGQEVPEEWRVPMEENTRALRVLAAVEDADARGRLYTALGTRKHEKGLAYTDEEIAAAVAEADLPDAVAAAVDDTSLDAAVRASHDEAQAAVGQESGSPVLRIGERAWFGPVVAPIPTGDEALRLFEAVRLLAEVPAFSELKTCRNLF
jgi:2-hydroxychromene-2-carboxylate isomerase